MKHWTEKYFDKNYQFAYKDTLVPLRTEREVDFITAHLKKETKTILDIPCGFGRHSVALAKLGYNVTGVDLYDAQLENAKKNAEGLDNVTFIKEDMHTFEGSGYDAVLCLFSSIGYTSREEDLHFIDSLLKKVNKGGTVIIDVLNPFRLIIDLSANDWKRVVHKGTDCESTTFDPIQSVVKISYKKEDVAREAVMNLYYPAEYLQIFSKYDYKNLQMFGSFKGETFDARTSPRLIFVIER